MNEIMAEQGAPLWVNAGMLARALLGAARGAAKGGSRPLLTGTFLEWDGEGILSITTADGYRLYHYELTAKSESPAWDITIPAKDLAKWARPFAGKSFDLTGLGKMALMPVILYPPSSPVRASYRSITLSVAGHPAVTFEEILGAYPKYRVLIPKEHDNKWVVVAGELLRCLEDAVKELGGHKNVLVVRLIPYKGEAWLVAEATTPGEMEVAARKVSVVSPPTLITALNSRYLYDTLKLYRSTDMVSISVSKAGAPALFLNSQDQAFVGVVMPMFVRAPEPSWLKKVIEGASLSEEETK